MSNPRSLYGTPDDSRLRRLAWKQHGVVGIWQLLGLGYSKHQIHLLIAKNHLIRIHRGVYAVGHERLSHQGRWMAAVLAFGAGAAVLSHGHAAALHDLRTVPSTAIDVTSPLRRKPTGVRAHWARVLDPADITAIDGIPVTTVARLLLDQAETLGPQKLRTLLEATLRRNLFDLNEINATVARNPGRHGIAPLMRTIGDLPDEAPWTQSEKERYFLEFIRAAGLPEPRVNVLVEEELVDFFWPEAGLIVEVDGWEWHKTHAVFEADRSKDAKHQVAGHPVLRYTARRIDREANAVEAEIRAMLSASNAGEAA